MHLLILLLFTLSFKYGLTQQNVAQERHDYSGSASPAEMYGPQRLKSDYKPLPWKDKFPRYDANVTEILELHKLTEKEPEFEPILTRKQEKGVDNRVPKLIRPVQVRCPKGWTPWGPLCIAEVSLGPRTECFGDMGRFVSSASGTLPKQSSLYPGICQEKREIGPSLACPAGMKLRLKYESETNSNTGEVTPDIVSWACEGYRVIPFSELDGGICPAGFVNSIEGCKAFQVVPPIAICPDNSQPSYIGSNFAFNQRTNMVCDIVKYSKGRIWCPKGFNVIFPPEALEKYDFGEEIPEEETYKIISGTYDENDQVSDEIVEDIFTTLNEFSELNDNQEFPINFNDTRKRGPDTISNNLFTSSSHYIKKSQANIQVAQMRGMGIDMDNNMEFEGSEPESNSKNCIKEKGICGDSKGLQKDEDNNLENKRKWDSINNSNNIMLRRLQEMAMGGSLETQIFEPGLEKELEYGPLSGVYMGNYGNVFGKQTEEEILISANLGQLMGSGQVTTAPLLQMAEKKPVMPKEPTCSLVVAVHSTNCTPLQCKSPFLKEINHVLRDWAVFVLQADPDSGSNLIPNGKDLPFTNAG
ncbi:uncharacterized protein cubi_03211 [Cryptosporidium ubiquitum]|uniref:Oocyst wall protein n=1 Tax=Cryptosporidium ubiquitum TaxID=857276 RepID=A0A1J4MP18_9CRYT|nr:uncharacterized protein cubi_03211 [Cryptosporidium ubiquitum]OII75195.1 hypothetical protein cubi_03211 [Cryptosporidium ubiquitum]